VENWLQSGISLGKTHYNLTEQWPTPGCACSWMYLALPLIQLVTTLRCLKIFQALQYKRQTFYYFYAPLHCKVHLTVLHVFPLGRSMLAICSRTAKLWEMLTQLILEDNHCMLNISLYWEPTIACSTLSYFGKLPLHAHRVRYASLVVFVLRLVHGPKMRNFYDFYQISCWPHSVLKCQQNTNRPDMMTPATSKAHYGA
jgi:hypothetical protein